MSSARFTRKGMQPRHARVPRSIVQPPLPPHSWLVLAWLPPVASFVLFFVKWRAVQHENSTFEYLIYHRLPAAATAPAAADPIAAIDISSDGAVQFNGVSCSEGMTASMPDLVRHVLRHKQLTPGAEIVIRTEATVEYQRIVDVLNAFETCRYRNYRLDILRAMPP
jgi:biopolymer transport protein ExbD